MIAKWRYDRSPDTIVDANMRHLAIMTILLF